MPWAHVHISHTQNFYMLRCRLLQQFQNKTATTDFVYLRRVPATPAEYNPYVLRVRCCQHKKACALLL